MAYFIDVLEKYFSFEDGIKRFRFHVRMTGGWLDWGQNLYSLACKAKSFSELREECAKFFESEQRMCARTQLRE